MVMPLFVSWSYLTSVWIITVRCVLITASTYTFIYTKVKIRTAFYFSRFKVSLYFSIEANWKNFTYHVCFPPIDLCVTSWAISNICDIYVAWFEHRELSAFQTLKWEKGHFCELPDNSIRKSLGNRKASWKQTPPIPFQMSWGKRPSWLSAHLMYVWTACQWICSTTAVPLQNWGALEEGDHHVLREHCINPSKWASVLFPFLHHLSIFALP